MGGDYGNEAECFRKDEIFEKHEANGNREVDDIHRMPFWLKVYEEIFNPPTQTLSGLEGGVTLAQMLSSQFNTNK